MKILFILFMFLFMHWFQIGFGLILFYSTHKRKLKQIAWSMVAIGLAPLFGRPKALHQWVANHCYANPIHIPDHRCTYWTCAEYGECEFSKKKVKK